MTPDQEFFGPWGIFQWAIGAAWTVGSVVTVFVWRLATRVSILESELTNHMAMLEREQRLREKADDERHKENVHVMRGLQQQLVGVIKRIDDMYVSMNQQFNRRDH